MWIPHRTVRSNLFLYNLVIISGDLSTKFRFRTLSH